MLNIWHVFDHRIGLVPAVGEIIYVFVSARPDKSVSQCEVNDQTGGRFLVQTSASWTLLFPRPPPVWSGLTVTWDFFFQVSLPDALFLGIFIGRIKTCCGLYVCQLMILYPAGKCIISQFFKASHLKLVLSNITMSQAEHRWDVVELEIVLSERGSQPNWSFSVMNQNPWGLYSVPCRSSNTNNKTICLCFCFVLILFLFFKIRTGRLPLLFQPRPFVLQQCCRSFLQGNDGITRQQLKRKGESIRNKSKMKSLGGYLNAFIP